MNYSGLKLCGLLIFSIPIQGQATEFNVFDNKVNILWDNTIAYGLAYRTESQKPAFAAQGDFSTFSKRAQINKNDGNNNFDRGVTANVVKLTSTLDLTYKNYGAVISGYAFYDEAIMRGKHDGGRVDQFENGGCGLDFCEGTRHEAGRKAEFLDAYVWGDFNIGSTPITLRLGHQVVQWGEALFLQDGINQVNPVSLADLRRPGSELREALIPLPMLLVQTQLTSNLSMELLYEFDWEKSRGDAVGTFLSTHDAFIGEGARAILTDVKGSRLEPVARVFNSFALGVSPNSPAATRLKTNRIDDREPGSDGQFGFSLRYFAESLNATEFGFYYLNVHARKQNAGIVLGEANGVFEPGSAACASALQLVETAAPASNVSCADFASEAALSAAGLSAAEIPVAQQFAGAANAVHYINSTQYYLNYEEDQEIFGVSFNTLVGTTSLAGEIAYRKDAAFLAEVGDNLIIYNALAAPDLGNGQESTAGQLGAHLPAGLSASSALNPNSVASTALPNGEEDMVNASLIAIHAFGPKFGFDEINGVLEVGTAYVAGLENKNYAAQDAQSFIPIPGVASDGTPDQYLDRFSWGYRIALVTSLNNMFPKTVLKPFFRLTHDVEGNSVVGGNYVEGRKSTTIGTKAIYDFNWEFAAALTSFFGARDRNQLQDRDHIAMSVKYNF